MEKWKEIFVGKIPKGVYQLQLLNGEKQGLLIELSNNYVNVNIKFGIVQALRMLDEGIVQNNLYSDTEIQRYKNGNFENVIYEVQSGNFGEQINEISGDYGEMLDLKHYVIITQNYNIDIVTEWEPIIEILQI